MNRLAFCTLALGLGLTDLAMAAQVNYRTAEVDGVQIAWLDKQG